jgi:UDP-N-acetylmuramyl-tripeptide synthetase
MAAVAHLTDVAAAIERLQTAGVRRLVTDSRRLQPGDAFLAYPGYVVDGRRFLRDAFARGARAAIVEREGFWAVGADWAAEGGPPRVFTLAGLKSHAGPLASLFLGDPSAAVRVAAVTGTNGKTSTSTWIAQAFEALGQPCGVVGTLGAGRLGALADTGLTTPDPVQLQAAFADLRDQGVRRCAIEASSIGLAEARLDGTRIDVAAFTNLTQDHLDYHGTMQQYAAAKRRLFEWPGLRAAVVHGDDPFARELLGLLTGRGVPAVACRVGSPVEDAAIGDVETLRIDEPQVLADGQLLRLHWRGQQAETRLRVPGRHNAENVAVVVGVLLQSGVAFEQAVAVVERLTPVPGRLQCLGGAPGQPLVVVDYAHSPDALAKALDALRPVAHARGGALALVFGCGGDRDRSKRAPMGRVAAAQADRLLLTSDNPRTEDPLQILRDIEEGLPRGGNWAIEADRAQAIERAVLACRAEDVLLIAGKGHEDYQIVGHEKRPFSDVAQAERALARRPLQTEPTEGQPC